MAVNFISTDAFCNSVVHMQASNAWQSPSVPAHKWKAGGGPPWGEFNPPATEGVPQRAKLIIHWLCPITAGQSRHSFAQFDLKCSYPYPFLSPGAWGSPEPGPKFLLSVSCWLILVDFFGFRRALEKRHRKNNEKNTKIKDFGLPKLSQNPPKILPK